MKLAEGLSWYSSRGVSSKAKECRMHTSGLHCDLEFGYSETCWLRISHADPWAQRRSMVLLSFSEFAEGAPVAPQAVASRIVFTKGEMLLGASCERGNVAGCGSQGRLGLLP